MIQPCTFTCSWYTAAISWVYFSLICGCKWKVSDMSVETVLTYAISPLSHLFVVNFEVGRGGLHSQSSIIYCNFDTHWTFFFKCLHQDSNDNGVRIVNFATSKNLVVKSTMFPHRNIHKYTWTSPDGKTHNQIDHVLIDRRWQSSVLDARCTNVSSINPGLMKKFRFFGSKEASKNAVGTWSMPK